MNAQQERLILDNPNLPDSKLASLTDLTVKQVSYYRFINNCRGEWFYKGSGIPFCAFHQDGYRVRKSGKKIFRGSFAGAMINVDRLIYCLENDGKHLLKTLEQKTFENLSFLER